MERRADMSLLKLANCEFLIRHGVRFMSACVGCQLYTRTENASTVWKSFSRQITTDMVVSFHLSFDAGQLFQLQGRAVRLN